MRYRLGFLGAGNMAEAIARAACAAGVVDASKMIASDLSADRLAKFESLGLATTKSNIDVLTQCDQVMLAVKPQTFPHVASEIGEHLSGDQVILSIMAGIGSAKIEAAIGREARVVRIMPNTPLQVGFGMAGVALGAHANAGDDDLAMALFSASGEAIRVEESQLDAITAISGSGPAYVFFLAEAMQKAAGELGLSGQARLLVNQTILGAAQLLMQSDDSAAELRRKVTSPGGTTEAAINHMQGNKTIDVVVNAMHAAEKRSRELGA